MDQSRCAKMRMDEEEEEEEGKEEDEEGKSTRAERPFAVPKPALRGTSCMAGMEMSCQDGQDGGGRGEIGGDAFTLALANGKLGNWGGMEGSE